MNSSGLRSGFITISVPNECNKNNFVLEVNCCDGKTQFWIELNTSSCISTPMVTSSQRLPQTIICSLFFILFFWLAFSLLHSRRSSEVHKWDRVDAFEMANRRNNFRCGPFDSCNVSHRTWSRYARLTVGTPLIFSNKFPYSIIAIMSLRNVGQSHAWADFSSRLGNSIDMWKGICWQADTCC